jgi:hypothetical protein
MDAQAAREKAHVVVESARSISRMLGSPMLTGGAR